MQVNISCKQIVEYSQAIEMSKHDFERLKDFDMDDINYDDYPEEFNLLQKYIDFTDVYDSEQTFKDVKLLKKNKKNN